MDSIFTKLRAKKNLTDAEAFGLQDKIMGGGVAKETILEIFKLFDEKGLADEELIGIVKATREKMVRVKVGFDCLDNCGTGGDGFDTFNISTVSALVCASAGIPVAKHGNRAASSKCGSADVLEKLGVKVGLGAEGVKKCLEEAGIAFMFAPNFHPAFRFVKEARAAFGKKTYFNILGPLVNPAGAPYQLVGLADITKAEIMGKTLMATGSKKVMLIQGQGGLDEISVEADTSVFEFTSAQHDDGGLKRYTINPCDYNLTPHAISEITGGDSENSAKIFTDILKNEATEAQTNAVLMNSAAGMVVFGKVADMKAGIELAREMIESGRALKKLEEFIEVSNRLE